MTISLLINPIIRIDEVKGLIISIEDIFSIFYAFLII